MYLQFSPKGLKSWLRKCLLLPYITFDSPFYNVHTFLKAADQDLSGFWSVVAVCVCIFCVCLFIPLNLIGR